MLKKNSCLKRLPRYARFPEIQIPEITKTGISGIWISGKRGYLSNRLRYEFFLNVFVTT